MVACPTCRLNNLRVYEDTRNILIYAMYVCNQCPCGLGASWEKCVQYVCQYSEQSKIRYHIKDPHTAIFTGPTIYRKSHFGLELIEKEYSKPFDYNIIISSTLWWNKTYRNNGLIRHDDNVWLIEPKEY